MLVLLMSDLFKQFTALERFKRFLYGGGEQVTAPGIPADYPTPEDLISTGCILPFPLEE
ncbi:MAG: hypothetical protein MUF87_15065 [Anaerolineae bacterium]|nr:hypothetical protein [Anaerolineae bacterium]